MSNKRLFLIDGNSHLYRAFYAIRELSTSQGRPTNAVYGFTNILLRLLREEKPAYLAVAFDLPGPTFRHDQFADYKAQRPQMPDELSGQIPLVKEILAAMHIPIFEQEGYEADDLIATLTEQAVNDDFDVYIVTGDKDALQLVSEKVKVIRSDPRGRGGQKIYDQAKVRKRYGVEPGAMIELMALMGDSTDNIPGVPGVGEKTASRLIKEFKSIEGLFTHLDSLPDGKLKENLLTFHDRVILNLQLVRIERNVPITIEWEKCRLREPDSQRLGRIFRELEFTRLLENVVSPKVVLPEKYQEVRTEAELDVLIAELLRERKFALECSLEDKHIVNTKQIGIGICWGKDTFYVPLAGCNNETVEGELPLENHEFSLVNSRREKFFSRLKPLLEDSSIEKYCANTKEMFIVLANSGINLRGVTFDVGIASHLLNPARSNHSLKEVAFEQMGIMIEEGTGVTGVKGVKERLTTCRTRIIWQLVEILRPLLKEKDLYPLFTQLEMPLVPVLASMERAGVSVDVSLLESMAKDVQRQLENLEDEIYRLAGESFNINSSKQLGCILFEKLKLPVVKRTKTGYSTDMGVLEKLALSSDLAVRVLDYRQLAKLKSTYIDTLPRLVNQRTGRIHTSFNQTVTATGRLSSSQPNLQNIPIRSDIGKQIRRAIIASDKKSVLLTADYSQIELRILAHFSGDRKLKEGFKRGVDIHRQTAAEIFAVPPGKVDRGMRRRAKAINFGIVYGISAFGLAKSAGVAQEEAQAFITTYFNRYEGVKRYIEETIVNARCNGFVTTLMGRRRYLPGITSESRLEREFAERTAVNTPIQGSAADLIKVAMIKIAEQLEKSQLSARMILQVHDELVFDLPESELKFVKVMVKELMEQSYSLDVPIVVDVKVGRNWLEAH